MSIRNLDALFQPAAIALIGAAGEPHSIGHALSRNLLSGGFSGPIMSVDPQVDEDHAAGRYRSIAALPATPELAIIAAAVDTVPQLVAQLGQHGCRAAIVTSAALDKRSRQAILDAARPHGLRIIGPNCRSFVSTPRGINASLAAVPPRAGHLALVSQSGTIASAMLDWADQRGIGFSHVLSLGEVGDVDFGDMLDYLGTDPSTRAILLYVENLARARKFVSAARAAARTRPVLVVKAGRSAAGARAALSHTGALAGTDAVYDAVFRRTGLLRLRELEELFAAASLLAAGTRVSGDRITILSNGGAAGILAVDALTARSGRLAELRPETVARLDAVLPEGWSRGNPVDILSDAGAERYAASLAILLEQRDSDAFIVLNCPSAVSDEIATAESVVQAASRHRSVPILTSWIGGTTARRSRDHLARSKVPTFVSPEEAVRAFTHLVEFRRNQELLLETPSAGVAIPPRNIAEAQSLLGAVRSDGRSVLTEPEAKRLIGLFGIASVATFTASTPEEAGRHFTSTGAPSVLKLLSPDITHKSDLGGVVLGLRSQADLEAAAHAMQARFREAAPEARQMGFSVQPMIVRPQAVELIVGIARDETFGPVLMFGRGGKATELIGDRIIGLPPLNSVLARDMIGRTRIARQLAGYRDVPPADLDAVVDVLVRLSELAVLLPEIAELDINPLLADHRGVIALDARIVIDDRAGRSGFAITPYPRALELDIAINDGTRFRLRPIRPEDETELAAMVTLCTPEDLQLRFLGPLKSLPHAMAARLSQIDYDREMAFVAVEPDSGYGSSPIFGVVRLIGDSDGESAEFAVLVRSDLKGRGLGYRLMAEILAYARSKGYRRVHSDVLQGNQTMLRMARDLGFVSRTSADDAGIAHITLTIERD